MYRTSEIAKKMGKTSACVLLRAKHLGLGPKGNKANFLWTEDQCESIENYVNIIPTKDKYSKIKINIVDFYLTHTHNTEAEIANKMGLSTSRVTSVLNEFLQTKHIIVESKINFAYNKYIT